LSENRNFLPRLLFLTHHAAASNLPMPLLINAVFSKFYFYFTETKITNCQLLLKTVIYRTLISECHRNDKLQASDRFVSSQWTKTNRFKIMTSTQQTSNNAIITIQGEVRIRLEIWNNGDGY